MTVIVWLVFDLLDYDVRVQHFSHYATGTPSPANKNWYKIKNKETKSVTKNMNMQQLKNKYTSYVYIFACLFSVIEFQSRIW